jgi:hypothetical protein
VRAAISALPAREQKVVGLYYYGEATMKEIGAAIGVNESRVSQLHARAIRRLRESLGDFGAAEVTEMRAALVAFAKPAMAKAELKGRKKAARASGKKPAVVLPYNPEHKRRSVVRPSTPLPVTVPASEPAVAVNQ